MVDLESNMHVSNKNNNNDNYDNNIDIMYINIHK